MLRMLSEEVNKSWSMFCVISVGNHAPHVVMKVKQQLEHSLCEFYGKSWCTNYYESGITDRAWSLLIENLASPVGMIDEQQLGLDLC